MFRYALKRSFSHFRCHYVRGITSLAPTKSRFSWTSSTAISVQWPLSLGRSHGRRWISSLSSFDDTIYALSSGQDKAGIAVIRVSGPGCRDVYEGLCPGKELPRSRYAVIRTLYQPGSQADGDVLDSSALVLFFTEPKTVTGEDVLELHIHGGPATVKAVLSAIGQCGNSPSTSSGTSSTPAPARTIRYAEPGEFTRRAFLNGRLDLAQVEALSNMLAADTEQQRRAAVRGAAGALGRTYDGWRAQLLAARAELEALIDFAEDQHFDEAPAELLGNVSVLVDRIVRAIRLHEVAGQRSELLRKGIRIALVGPPNVGKSSLMNLIVGREASIVSAEVGTTRDIVEASLDIGGYLCSFADTAGFRSVQAAETNGMAPSGAAPLGAVEKEGIRRARKKAEDSDIVVVVAAFERGVDGNHFIHYDQDTLRLAARANKCLIVVNKSDRVESEEERRSLLEQFSWSVLSAIPELAEARPLVVSCSQAEGALSAGQDDPGGLQSVVGGLTHAFSSMTCLPDGLGDLLGVTERQRQLLEQCRFHLEEYLRMVSQGAETEGAGEPDIVIAAEDLRIAADYLARITGRGEAADVEEVLGVIFEKFCVGK